MMIHYGVPDGNGKYLQTGSCVALENAPVGAVQLDQATDPRFFYHDAILGKAVPLPVKTSYHHVFAYESKQWVDPRTAATEWVVVRKKRDSLLAESDFTQLADSNKNPVTWRAYRKALRDITLQADPFSIVWPTVPD